MPLIRKEQAGSCPGYAWDNDGDVVEVDADMASALLAMPDGGFSEVAPPEPGGAADPVGDGASAPDVEVVEAPVADSPAPKKRAYTRKTAAAPAEVAE
jgi:hypothetical protein